MTGHGGIKLGKTAYETITGNNQIYSIYEVTNNLKGRDNHVALLS